MKRDRVVVITGAGGGIGSKIVDRFLANGDAIVAFDRDEAALEVLRAWSKTAGRLSTCCVDIADTDAVQAFASQIRADAWSRDVLVNCAGYYPVVPFEQMTLAQWQEVITINLTGMFQMTHTLLP